MVNFAMLQSEMSRRDLFGIFQIPTSSMKEADDIIPFLPVKEKVTHKLIVESEPKT